MKSIVETSKIPNIRKFFYFWNMLVFEKKYYKKSLNVTCIHQSAVKHMLGFIL